MSRRYDAIVIGGDASGLTAAAYLAKAGLKTVLLEKREALPISGEPVLHALDPRVVKDMKLARAGLGFAFRDLSLIALRAGGPPLTIPRDSRHPARTVATLSLTDAEALPLYLDALHSLGRALRPAWWDGRPLDETVAALRPAQRELAERLAVTSAAAYTASWFETDVLRAALAFDAARAGFAPTEPGSALALAWSASQEMCGMQGASALPTGGLSGLVQALAGAAQQAGAEVRTVATVTNLVLAGDRIAGVELATGERLEAPIALSTLSRYRTLALAPDAVFGLGAVRRAPAPPPATLGLMFGLNRAEVGAALTRPGHRNLIADRPEIYAQALMSIRLGNMPRDLALELVLPPSASTVEALASRVQLYVRAWPIPPQLVDDRDAIVRIVTAGIERLAPGFGSRIASSDVLAPQESEPASVARLSSSSDARIATVIPGVYLCGRSAEPADAVSCRAARHAVKLAMAQTQRSEPR